MQTPIAAPPPSVSGSTGQTAPSTGNTSLPSGTGTAPNVPPTLATALNAGVKLPAQVTAQAGGQAGGQATGQTAVSGGGGGQGSTSTLTLSVQVPSGTGGQGQTVPVQVQTALPLPPGTSLNVSLQGSGPPAVLFLQPNSGSTQAAGQGQGAGQTGQGTAAQAGAARPAVVTSLTQGSVFTATVTGTATSGTSSPGNAGSTAQAAGQAGRVATAPSAALSGQAAPSLPTGATVQVQLLSFAPPGQPLSASGTANGFLATVTGSTPSGTAVQTNAGALSLALPNAPPTGSQLLLSMVGDPILPTSTAGAASANRFQALQDAVALLRSGDPAAAQRLTQGLLPQPNAQFGLAAAFLLNAMRQGGVDRWLGRDTARSLEALGGKDGPLGKLSAELSQPPGRATDGAGQEWRVTQLPVMGDGQIDQIRLYTKPGRHSGEGDAEGDEAGRARRFVIEATFSQLGPIQLDGFSQDKQIDMVLRSQKPLAAYARDEIRALFADTISALGYAGSARFQVVPAFDLVPERSEDAPGGWTV